MRHLRLEPNVQIWIARALISQQAKNQGPAAVRAGLGTWAAPENKTHASVTPVVPLKKTLEAKCKEPCWAQPAVEQTGGSTRLRRRW